MRWLAWGGKAGVRAEVEAARGAQCLDGLDASAFLLSRFNAFTTPLKQLLYISLNIMPPSPGKIQSLPSEYCVRRIELGLSAYMRCACMR